MEQTERLIRENERLRATLEIIKNYAYHASIGAWRQEVYDMAKQGLERVEK